MTNKQYPLLKIMYNACILHVAQLYYNKRERYICIHIFSLVSYEIKLSKFYYSLN